MLKYLTFKLLHVKFIHSFIQKGNIKPLIKWFLIGAIQVRSGVNIQQLSISLEVPDTVVNPAVVRNSTLETAVDYVGDKAISRHPIGCKVRFCRLVATYHDIVARWLRFLLGHPKPKCSFESDNRVVGYYVWVF